MEMCAPPDDTIYIKSEHVKEGAGVCVLVAIASNVREVARGVRMIERRACVSLAHTCTQESDVSSTHELRHAGASAADGDVEGGAASAARGAPWHTLARSAVRHSRSRPSRLLWVWHV